MAANTKAIFELTPVNAGMTYTSGSGTDRLTIYTAGVNGGRIDGILVSSNDTAAVNLAFYINDGVNDNYIGNVVIPIGAGYTTVTRIDAMLTLKPYYQNFIQMKAGYKLKANAVATMTAAKTLTIVVIGGDF